MYPRRSSNISTTNGWTDAWVFTHAPDVMIRYRISYTTICMTTICAYISIHYLGVLISGSSLNASNAVVARFLPLAVTVGHHNLLRTKPYPYYSVASKSSAQRREVASRTPWICAPERTSYVASPTDWPLLRVFSSVF